MEIERSRIISFYVPKNLYTVEKYLKLYKDETEEGALTYISKQKSRIETATELLRKKYKSSELTDQEILLLIEYQVEKNLKYNQNARMIKYYDDVEFILKEIDRDPNFFHNAIKIGKLLEFESIQEIIVFSVKYSNTTIWKELLQMTEYSKINRNIIEKIKTVNRINSRIKGDISLEMLNQWNGDISSLVFENNVSIEEFTEQASLQEDYQQRFYKYNEEVVRINKDGKTFYSKITGKGHPKIAVEMYEKDIEITQEMKKGNGVEIYIKAAQELNSITILGAGERPQLYLPENLTLNQKKVLFRLMKDCNIKIFKIGVIFIDENGTLKEPLFVDEFGSLSDKKNLDSFIDYYLGRYSEEELEEYEEKDLHLEKSDDELSLDNWLYLK